MKALRTVVAFKPATRDEVKVAPNIYKTPSGWRVYVRRRDPETGKSRKYPKRFLPHFTLEELIEFRDSARHEAKKERRLARLTDRAAAATIRGLFPADAKAYLALKTVKAMPSFRDRERDIERWAKVFKKVPRKSITTKDVDEQLQAWIDEGYAASTVNGRRTALMALFTTLDGRAAANPVRDTKIFEEPELQPRGIPIVLVMAILNAIPDVRSHSHLRTDTKPRSRKTKPRLMLEALTGMRPSQIGRLERTKHFSLEERWYVIPRTQKGQGRQRRMPRPMVRLYMNDQQLEAFTRFDALGCYGEYSAQSRRRVFMEAVRVAQEQLREQLQDPTFSFPKDLRPYDLRHSFGTEVLRQTKSLETTAEMLGQTSTRMTKRYALGAISDVVKSAALALQAVTPAAATAATPALSSTPKRRKGSKEDDRGR